MINAKRAKKELEWLNQQAHHELNITSNMSGIIAAIHYGNQDSTINHQEDRMIAIALKDEPPVAKMRRIEKALARISSDSRRILDATYAGYLYPPELTATFGELTGAALFNQIATELSTLIIICRSNTIKSKYALVQIKRQAELLSAGAHEEYASARNRMEMMDED